MKFIVKAIGIDAVTGDTLPARDETIDTATNVLFEGCSTPWEVEDRYEAFWNRLNPSWETRFPNEHKVKVVSVVSA